MKNIKENFGRNKEAEPMSSKYTVIRPGGNDTALVIGLNVDQKKRKEINDQIMAANGNVEQVGFVNLDLENLELQMAGGEFCGNATRSTVWLALGGRAGETLIKVSGVDEKLAGGVRENGDAWAQMPIKKEISAIKIGENGEAIVTMDGITQVVVACPEGGFPPELAKEIAKKKLGELNLLDTVPAAGVMFLGVEDGKLKIDPVVWVRSIQTFFYETACGSGTTAVGLVEALRNGGSVQRSVTQPSGMSIDVSVDFDGEQFNSAVISGPVEQLGGEKEI